MFDIHIVHHRVETEIMAHVVAAQIEMWAKNPVNIYFWDNQDKNIGFARACNLSSLRGDGEIIGFINPDMRVYGDITEPVLSAFENDIRLGVVGTSFAKSRHEIKAWGLQNWVCGAAFFVIRPHWIRMNGFDEDFVWSHEETDFCKRTEMAGKQVKSIAIPIEHLHIEDRPQDTAYKQKHYEEARRLYSEKWGVKA